MNKRLIIYQDDLNELRQTLDQFYQFAEQNVGYVIVNYDLQHFPTPIAFNQDTYDGHEHYCEGNKSFSIELSENHSREFFINNFRNGQATKENG